MSTALSELHLILASAFLPPQEDAFATAFRRDLAFDLAELARELPFDCSTVVEEFSRSLEAVDSDTELLKIYSALFLQPPIRASLNASVHLDGAAMGPTTLSIERRYAAEGLEADAALKDLPDHLTRMLAFAGHLWAQRGADAEGAKRAEGMAREFSRTYLRPWLPSLAIQVRGACDEMGLARVYQHLAELAVIAAYEGDAWRKAVEPVDEGEAPKQASCKECGRPYAEEAALRAVRRIMARKGLNTAHLDLCEDCRGVLESQGGKREPPGLRM